MVLEDLFLLLHFVTRPPYSNPSIFVFTRPNDGSLHKSLSPRDCGRSCLLLLLCSAPCPASNWSRTECHRTELRPVQRGGDSSTQCSDGRNCHSPRSVKSHSLYTMYINLAYRRLRGDMIEVYKIIHNIYDHESVPNLLKNNEISQRTGNRGHSVKLFTQRAKLNLRKSVFPI